MTDELPIPQLPSDNQQLDWEIPNIDFQENLEENNNDLETLTPEGSETQQTTTTTRTEKKRKANKQTEATAKTTKIPSKWTEEDKRKLEEGLKLYGQDFEKLTQFVGTKTMRQIKVSAHRIFPNLCPRQPKKPPRASPKTQIPTTNPSSTTQPSSTTSMANIDVPWLVRDETLRHSTVNLSLFNEWIFQRKMIPNDEQEIQRTKLQQRSQVDEYVGKLQALMSRFMLRSVDPSVPCWERIFKYIVCVLRYDEDAIICEALDDLSEVDVKILKAMFRNLRLVVENVEFGVEYKNLLERCRKVFNDNNVGNNNLS